MINEARTGLVNELKGIGWCHPAPKIGA